MKSLLSLLLVGVLLTSCDIIDNPVQNPDVPIDTSATFKQNVLIEDYTGHTCGNCPEAAEVAHQLQTVYSKERVIVVAVHSGHFADPLPPDYPEDYRTPEGNELDETFRISRAGNPNGLVNRVKYNGKLIQSKDNWAPATSQYLTEDPVLGISATSSWDITTSTVTINADLTFIKEGTPDYFLAAWVIEDSLISDQTDYRKNPSHIEEYEFEHVLRTSIGGVWGSQLSTTATPAGTKLSKQLTYTFPTGTVCKPKNCSIVLFVHRHQTEKNVVQVVSIPVIPK